MPTPPSIPPEILDYIIDLLRDEPETLKRCCLVAKLWIPRTRKHLFADIQFSSIDDLRLWKKTFPDSANSPAYHTRTLFASCAQADVAATVDENGWTRAFSGVTSLSLESHLGQATLVPFHRFSPTLKSLHAHYFIFPSPQLFAFILSSPLLEDLTLAGLDIGRQDDHDDPREPQTAAPSTSPPLTGTLRLHIAGRIEDTVCRLLSLPNGLHFRKLVFSQARSRDVRWIMELLIRCSDSLECLDIMCYLPLDPESEVSIDLSKATRLRSVVFRVVSSPVGWIAMALRTIAPEHRDLREISIRISHSLEGFSISAALGEAAFGRSRWLDLDRILVQLWESRSIRPRVGWEGYITESWLACLLPEAAKRGIVDPI